MNFNRRSDNLLGELVDFCIHLVPFISGNIGLETQRARRRAQSPQNKALIGRLPHSSLCPLCILCDLCVSKDWMSRRPLMRAFIRVRDCEEVGFLEWLADQLQA